MITKATVTLTVEVSLNTTWADGSTARQIFSQAKEAAITRLTDAAKKVPGFKITASKVTMISTAEKGE